jgi:hypothetical protein
MQKLITALALVASALALPAHATSHKEAPNMAKGASAPMAGGGDCDAKATEKKLSGAAKASFVKKCSKDSSAMSAKADCDAKAGEKKLAGAAKNSFVKKCVADASK